MERILIVCNWKMNLLRAQAFELTEKLRQLSTSSSRSDLWIAASFTALTEVARSASGSQLKFGAQNVHWEANGAFTGEVSVPMLLELGCSFAIVGHSERRHVFGETDELVVKRATGALGQGLPIIFCIGENLKQRERGETEAVLETQLTALLNQLQSKFANQLVIAYEPVWAIGTGKVASPKEIRTAHDLIKRLLGSVGAPLLYGGSVSPENFSEIIAIPNVNGVLVGGASLHFEKIAKMFEVAETSA